MKVEMVAKVNWHRLYEDEIVSRGAAKKLDVVVTNFNMKKALIFAWRVAAGAWGGGRRRRGAGRRAGQGGARRRPDRGGARRGPAREARGGCAARGDGRATGREEAGVAGAGLQAGQQHEETDASGSECESP